MKSVLFVCTGNTFRSACAEYLLRNYAQKNSTSLTVASAGTRGNPLGVFPETLDAARAHGVDMAAHKFQVLTQELLDTYDLIICMAKHHQDFIKQRFDLPSLLFNQLAIGEATDIQDDDEANIWPSDPRFKYFVKQTVDIIAKRIPAIYAYCIQA